MEASRKRKAPNATPSSAEGSASKKIKLLNSAAAPKAIVQEVGLRILGQLKDQTDKSGRYIAAEFVELPDEDELPEYYEFIKLPLSLDTIEKKLKCNEYATVTAVESDLKRLVQNAKDYNDPKSEIHGDAEKIRKLVFNFMKEHNPAYKEDPRYTAVATPIVDSHEVPKLNGVRKEESVGAASVDEKPKRPATARSSEQADRKPSVAPSTATADAGADDDDEDDEGGGASNLDFTGKTFQEAQQMIVSFLLRYTDDEGLEIYTPFGNLPSRKLEEYYKYIKHPVSLKSVAKRARGQHGRAPPSGTTDFKTWNAFEEEVSFIWRNAMDFNEDGSDMFILAGDFKEHFRSLLAEAKDIVEEPAGPRIKLGGPKPKVLLNLSQNRGSPAPGVSVDNEALARQRQMVNAGANGQQMAARPAPTTNGVSSLPSRPSSSAHSGTPPVANVKMEKTPTQSPALSSAVPTSQHLTHGMMPPPAVRPPSGSPYPSQPLANNIHYTAPTFLPPTQLRTYPKEAALLPVVTINSHPQLKVSKPFNMSIAPHATLSHQSTTTTLPSSHYFLQICATISKQLSMGRPYKIFVSVNGTRLTQRDTQFHSDSGKRTHVYEGSLAQGVNRIEVEVAAAKMNDEKGLDVEKVTCYANMMR